MLSYKFRLYPNKKQEEYFSKCFGSTRFLWNKILSDRIQYYKDTGNFLKISSLKKYKNSYKFLKEVDSHALCEVVRNLDKAYLNFFKGYGFGFPKFKSKKYRNSYTTYNVNNSIRILNNKIKLPKIGYVKLRLHRKINGDIKHVTVEKDSINNYYISICCEIDKKYFLLPIKNTKIGVDLGIKNLYTDSNGNKIVNPRFYKKSLNKIKKIQKSLSRKQKGSKNYEKTRIKLAKIHIKIKNQRKYYLHNISKQLIFENQEICLESLNIKDMSSKRAKFINRSATDTGLSIFLNYIVYKASLYGRTIKTVPKYFPSSRLCSSCGEMHSEMKNLSCTKLVCKKCGTILDRDYNAAINILNNAK